MSGDLRKIRCVVRSEDERILFKYNKTGET